MGRGGSGGAEGAGARGGRREKNGAAACAVLPMAQKELPSKDADGNGIISPACCTQMEPLVTNNYMCTKQAMGYLYQALEGRGITDLNTYTPLLSGVMDKLSCTALNNMVFYPSSQCPASRRMGLFR